MTRLELAASYVTGRRSNRSELHPHSGWFGGRRGTRTPDIFGVNEALYRLSYPPPPKAYIVYQTIIICVNE